MQMLKAAVLPLIISSIIPGTAALKPKENGRVSAVALTYIIITNIIGAATGTVLAVIFRPGSGAAPVDDSTSVDTGNLETSDLFADLIRNLFPDNVVAACFQKVQTRYRDEGNGTAVRYLSTAGGTNILGLVIVCTAVGMAAAQTGDAAQPFLRFFLAAADVIIRLVQWIIWLTPLGVASLIAKALASTTDLESTFLGLGLFVLAEVIGNFLLAFILVPAIYLVFLRKNPFLFLAGASRAIITGVASASSAVTMPEIINCVERKHYVDVRVSRFVVPLATAINRDGSAMFIALTSVYIAQLQGADTANNIILLVILAAVGSLAIPGVPSASIVTILMILSSLDISPCQHRHHHCPRVVLLRLTFHATRCDWRTALTDEQVMARRNFVPDNVVTACFQKTQTRYREKPAVNVNITSSNDTEYERFVGSAGGMNILEYWQWWVRWAIPGVPSASVVTILMILAVTRYPPANIGIILALEWYSYVDLTFTVLLLWVVVVVVVL
nr:hypothetical protein BaRGS_023859 [Batillaria attramentaria]